MLTLWAARLNHVIVLNAKKNKLMAKEEERELFAQAVELMHGLYASAKRTNCLSALGWLPRKYGCSL